MIVVSVAGSTAMPPRPVPEIPIQEESPRKGAEVKESNSVSCPGALVGMAGDDYMMRVSEIPRDWIEIGGVGDLRAGASRATTSAGRASDSSCEPAVPAGRRALRRGTTRRRHPMTTCTHHEPPWVPEGSKATMQRRYFFHIRDGGFVSVDDEGMEFATPREADAYGARVAVEIGTDDRDYDDTELSVVDARGNEIARHRIHRQLRH